MLYSEFIEGTGCRENEHNFQIYKRLELMYMADDTITKQEIYDYGKKLVDNSPSEQEFALIEQIKAEIKDYENQLASIKEMVDTYTNAAKQEDDPIWKRHWNGEAKRYKEDMRRCKAKIKALRWVLAS